MMRRIAIYTSAILVAVGIAAAVAVWQGRVRPNSGYGSLDYRTIRFQDTVASNASPVTDFADFEFVDLQGRRTRLGDYLGRKNVVLVVTRGYPGAICIYCSTQTSRLMAQYAEIAQRDAEVVVVFPVAQAGDAGRLREFIESSREKLTSGPREVPFPIVLDVELKVVDVLGIRRDLSKPATYVIDKRGNVRFAYVGASRADRPSVEAILSQLDKLRDEQL
jgi:peroxiredoxin